MKFRQSILLIVTIIIVFSGCDKNNAQTIMSENLITTKLEDIDMAQIDNQKQGSKQTVDREILSNLYESLNGIEMQELTAEQENVLMKNAEIMYFILLMSNKDIVGSAMILKTGDIIMYDIETMKSGKRTQAYIHYDLNNEMLEKIIKLTDLIK
ncbi:hypothetical protein [Anaerosolibacter sp.]|uniref:hypothetical protein n=1 Tax=Anaerosolibacter sp. TaxID=1872527 RepID=UPI0039EFDFFD